MKCNDIENKLIDYIEENLTKEESLEIKKHIDACATCQKEVNEMQLIFGVIDKDLEETPSKNLKLNFEAILNEEKKQTKVIPLQSKTNWKSHIRIAASILIVVSAFLIAVDQPFTRLFLSLDLILGVKFLSNCQFLEISFKDL